MGLTSNWIMKKTILILLLAASASCKEEAMQSPAPQIDADSLNLAPFYGHWLINDYFSPLKTGKYSGSLSASHLGITEIVFSPDFKDSVLFINQDLEASMEKIDMLSKDTVRLHLTDSPYDIIVLNQSDRMLEYQIDERYPKYTFYKAPDSLVEPTLPSSAFRKSLYALFDRTLYYETGDNRYPESRSKIKLDKEGNVRGIESYSHYEIVVNGDSDNIENASRIELSNEKTKDAYGLKLTEEGFDLYHIKLTTEEGEKPQYKPDKLFKSYTAWD